MHAHPHTHTHCAQSHVTAIYANYYYIATTMHNGMYCSDYDYTVVSSWEIFGAENFLTGTWFQTYRKVRALIRVFSSKSIEKNVPSVNIYNPKSFRV